MNYIYIAYIDLQPLYVDPVPPSGVIPLYVGVTGNFAARLRRHRDTKAWWRQLVDHVDYFEASEDRIEAETIESRHIRLLAPVFNITDHPAPDHEWVNSASAGEIRITIPDLVAHRQSVVNQIGRAA